MADHDELPVIVIERSSGAASAFLWGALLGAGAALLLAPRTGEETQRELRDGAERLRRAAEDRVQDARDAVYDRVDRTRERLQDGLATARDVVESRVDQVRSAVDAGRVAAIDARRELQTRVDAAKSVYASNLQNPSPIVSTETVIIAEVISDADPGRDLG